MATLYSPAPKEAYTITHEGRLYGIGLHPVFSVVPGAWNLLWLLAAPQLEVLLNYRGASADYPTYFPGAMPSAVGTALQRCGEGLKTWGDLAEELSSKDFMRRMRAAVEPPPLVVKAHGEIILEIMQDNAKLYFPMPDNVVWVDVWKAGIQ